MEWISVKDRLPEEEQVLVTYLGPFFGGFTLEMTIAYYDKPYEDHHGEGWVDWHTENKILVTHLLKEDETI